MPAEEMEDTEVAFAGKASRVGNSGTARGMVHEVVDPTTGDVQIVSGKAVEHEDVREGGAPAKRFKPSTEALLDKLAQGNTEEVDPDDVGLVEGVEVTPKENSEGTDDTPGDTTPGDGEGTDDAPKTEEVVNEWQTKAEQFETANQRLLAELEDARKTPKAERTDYEQALVDAHKAYVDEGSVTALKKFLGAVLGVAADSKEVAEELSGLYIDLTAQEVGVPLDKSQQAIREAARARQALARDKRERAESEKKTANRGNSAEEQNVANSARYIDSILNVKTGQNERSLAETYPNLVAMSAKLDGMKPGEMLARAILREIKTGALAPTASEAEMIKHTATKIENYYQTLRDSFPKVATKNPTDTTSQGPAGAKPASKDQRQSTGARTINNAKASAAPAANPKSKQPAQKPAEKTRKDFKSNKEWQDYLFAKNGVK